MVPLLLDDLSLTKHTTTRTKIIPTIRPYVLESTAKQPSTHNVVNVIALYMHVQLQVSGCEWWQRALVLNTEMLPTLEIDKKL